MKKRRGGNKNNSNSNFNNFINKFKIAPKIVGIIAIIAIIYSMPFLAYDEHFKEIYSSSEDYYASLTTGSIIYILFLSLLMLILELFIFSGWISIADQIKNKHLNGISKIFIGALIISFAIKSVFFVDMPFAASIYSVLFLLISALWFAFGVILIREKLLGKIGLSIGVLYCLLGFLQMTFVLSFYVSYIRVLIYALTAFLFLGFEKEKKKITKNKAEQDILKNIKVLATFILGFAIFLYWGMLSEVMFLILKYLGPTTFQHVQGLNLEDTSIILVAIIAALATIDAVGLFKCRIWARKLGLILSFLIMAISLFSAAAFLYLYKNIHYAFITLLILSFLIFFFLIRKKVKDVFKR